MTLVLVIGLVVLGYVKGTWAVVLVAGATLLEVSQTLGWLWYSQRRAVQVGAEALLGKVVQVAEECNPYGHIRVQGELWRAQCAEGALRGDHVRIVGRDGLTLEVVREPD